MHETWDPERLLRSCDHTQRSRHADATRDLLTEPGWGKWEGVAEEGPATYDDLAPLFVSRGSVPVLFVSQPSSAACIAVWCLVGMALLVLAGMVWEWVGWG